MELKEVIYQWLKDAIAPMAVPISAFSFNLFEVAADPQAAFGVELIGSGWFDSEDHDWACDEVWTASPRGIAIPTAISGTSWDDFQSLAELAILEILRQENDVSDILKSSSAVAIGFVDGDLKLIWKQKSS